MGYRLSKIYTRTGDDGRTSLGDGKRILKNDPRLELMGTVDELNSAIGLVLAYAPDNSAIRACLTRLQHELFDLGGELCPPHHPAVTKEKVAALENAIDEWNANLPPLMEFILPGGNVATAACHVARTVCRRAERCAVALSQEEDVSPEILRYVNRLSDVLFVAARMLAKENTINEVSWNHTRL